MKAIATVFPASTNVLCVWHINKNVLSNTRKLFDVKEHAEFLQFWSRAVYAQTAEEYEGCMSELEDRKACEAWKKAMEYVRQVWLPLGGMFLKHRTNAYMHFGMTSTSRAEGSHHILKNWMKTPKCDMLMVFQRLDIMLRNQFVKLEQKMKEDKVSIAHKHRQPNMRNLIGRVSKFALEKLEEHKGRERTRECTGTYTSVWGLPCKHRVWEVIDSGTAIELSEVHTQWLLDDSHVVSCSVEGEPAAPLCPLEKVIGDLTAQLRGPDYSRSLVLAAKVGALLGTSTQSLENPQVVTEKRGRPADSVNKGMKRTKSAFESAEGHRCSNCGDGGHNRATC